MNRTALRRAAIGTGVLLAVVLVAAAIFVATFDVNRYTPELVDAVHARTGRTLRFEGDLSLSLFPRLALKLPATTVSEPGREAVFARLQSGAASVALLPLLRGDIAVDAVRVEGLQATIVREKDGRTNIDDLLRPKREAGSGAKGGAPAATGGPTIGAVQLKNSNVTWRDLAAGRTVQFSGLDLRAGRYAAGARMPIDASANVSVNDPQLAARIELDADVEWNEQGGLRAIRGLALKGDGTLKKQPMALDAKAERLVLGADAIDVRGLRITASGKAADGAPIELKVDAPRIDVGAEKAGGERVEVSFSRRGAAPLEGKLHIEGLRGNAARLEAGAVKVSASSRSGDRTTRLDLSSALTASIKEKLVRFERAVGELAIEDPALAQRPLRLPVNASGTVDGARETAVLQLDSRGEALSFRGKFTVAGFAKPRIGFDIDADQADIDRYFPARSAVAPAAGATGATGATKAGRPAAPGPVDDKLDLTALQGLNASGNVRVARLRYRGIDAADLRVALKAADGRLEASPVSVRMHGGSLNGRVSVDARGNRVAANGSLAGIQLRRAMSDIGGRAAIEGSASGTFEFATAGATTAQLKRALDGRLAVTVRDGALVGIDLADLLGTAAGFLQSRSKQTGTLDENKRTPFTQLSASVTIDDGVATNNDLKAQSPQLDITGSGRMDLVSTELDYALRATVLQGPGIERGPLRSLAGVTVPIRVAGPIAQPSYAVDWSSVAADTLLKRATGRSGAPAVNELIEGLGDLLKRPRR